MLTPRHLQIESFGQVRAQLFHHLKSRDDFFVGGHFLNHDSSLPGGR
jgi:hypothetical protein